MFISKEKISSIPNFFFQDIVKILQTCYTEYFENPWSCPSIMIVSPCRKLWCSKCWNQFAGNFDHYLHAKNQLRISILFWDIVKILQTCYSGNFGNAWPSLSKIIALICRKRSDLSACRLIIIHFFLKIIQKNSKLVILGNLGMSGYTHLNGSISF